jgi:hypothetical protein
MSGFGGDRDIERDHRERGVKARSRRRRRHRDDRHIKVKPARAPAQEVRIGDHIEGRKIKFGPALPDRQSEVRADAGGFAKG